MSARQIPRTLGDLSPVTPTHEQRQETTPRPGSQRSNPASPLDETIEAMTSVFSNLLEIKQKSDQKKDKESEGWQTESDKVKLDTWPKDAADFPNWYANAGRIIAAASGTPIAKSDNWKDLTENDGFESLSYKIRVSMDHIAPQDFKRKITLKEKELEAENELLTEDKLSGSCMTNSRQTT